MRDNQKRLVAQAPQPAASTAVSSGGLEFVVPTEFVELPSKGKYYREGHPLCGEETVEIKFMTAKEEDILSSSTLLEKGLVFDRLFENIIVEEIDPRTLVLSDRNAIMIAARSSAYGNVYKVDITCNKCDLSQDFSFDLKKKNFNEECFDNEFLKDNGVTFDQKEGSYEVKLPAAGHTVGIKMLTGEKETIEAENDERNITRNLLKFICSVNGDDNDEIINILVDNLLASDSMFLRILIPSLTPSISLKQDFKCSDCKNIEAREVPLSAAFFWPRQ